MSTSAISNSPKSDQLPSQRALSPLQKGILVALSAIFAIGMILSYALGAPWIYPFLFFSFTLMPLLPLGRSVDRQREEILPSK